MRLEDQQGGERGVAGIAGGGEGREVAAIAGGGFMFRFIVGSVFMQRK